MARINSHNPDPQHTPPAQPPTPPLLPLENPEVLPEGGTNKVKAEEPGRIKPKEFNEAAESNRWKDLFNHLRGKGLEVYPPLAHKGVAERPYVVVRLEAQGPIANTRTEVTIFDLLCYVPEGHYEYLLDFIKEVKEAMLSLRPMLSRYITQSPILYDEAARGFYIELEYENYAKTPGLR